MLNTKLIHFISALKSFSARITSWWGQRCTSLHRRKRTGLVLVPYSAADALLNEGWTIAPEEDNNHKIGIVYLEKLE